MQMIAAGSFDAKKRKASQQKREFRECIFMHVIFAR